MEYELSFLNFDYKKIFNELDSNYYKKLVNKKYYYLL